MHHKYFIIDRRVVATGSYNLSDNAERNTMENMIILDGAAFPGLAEAFLSNFEALWHDPEDADLYQELMDDVVDGSDAFPLVFEPMSLNWGEITELKRAMREHCPDINSQDFRENPRQHTVCYPDGQ
jgi:phosphatidylserine/phosphatidylglycerophosphate/cardiolipin synthase-like enzyme